MFGASKPANGGLFGQSNTNTTANNQGGLFGAKPASTGGLFGNTTNSTAPNTLNQPTQQTQGSGFSFGGSLSQQPQQQPQQPQSTLGGGSGLFGSTASTNKPAFGNSNSLFGQVSQPQRQQPANSLFGAQAQKPANSLFGSQTQQTQPAFGQVQNSSFNQNSLQQPNQTHMQPLITPFTRPSDLPEPIQKESERTDNYIRQQMRLSEDLSHVLPDHQALVTSIPRDVQLSRFKLTSAKETLKFDDGQLAKSKRLVDTDLNDAELLAEVTNQPRKYDRLMPYFRKLIDREPQIDQLAMAMRDVQQAVTAEEFGKRVTYDDQGLKTLPDALKEEYLYFMSLSDRVAELHRHIKDREGGETDEMQV